MTFGSITSDCWLSNTTMSYISLTVHFVDKLFVFRNFTLNLQYFDSEHTATKIKEILTEMLTNWNIANKANIR